MSSQRLSVVLLMGALVAGCGSKISEPNYYKIQHGMTEDDVADLLGPATHEEASAPATATPATSRKIRTWTRGGLTIRVVFEKGIVVTRSADGIPFEDEARHSTAATAPAPT